MQAPGLISSIGTPRYKGVDNVVHGEERLSQGGERCESEGGRQQLNGSKDQEGVG
jgi:hypothetical protein